MYSISLFLNLLQNNDCPISPHCAGPFPSVCMALALRANRRGRTRLAQTQAAFWLALTKKRAVMRPQAHAHLSHTVLQLQMAFQGFSQEAVKPLTPSFGFKDLWERSRAFFIPPEKHCRWPRAASKLNGDKMKMTHTLPLPATHTHKGKKQRS